MDAGVLRLRENADKRLRSGHLWVYSNEIDIQKTPLTELAAGQPVVIENAKGKPLAAAFANPHALICARIVSRSPKLFLSRSLLKKRMQAADEWRSQLFGTPHYRMVFGDSDGLPGLVIDRFGADFVAQISTAGMELFKDDVVDILKNNFSARTVILKNDGKMREVEGLERYTQCFGDEIETLEVIENGVSMSAPAQGGQKTGWFYDHRPNRAALFPWVKGKRVLDLFSYVGGWGVQTLANGAESVTFVDSSESALEWAQRNCRLQMENPPCRFIREDAFNALENLCQEKEKFDVVIVDPPALIPRRKDQKQGERAYQRLNQMALRLTAPGGMLMSASCSMHLSSERLRDILRASAREVDRTAQLIFQGGQGADHPILPAIPETDYIKAMLLRVTPTL
ncbi:class I SAM-dependent rRNA methyltransferase [Hahella sp. CR1]|uniref:class I SAM-dependent rRNA methyltransferase n=1 Tax=Hahella sp. CR1 TaxID=2992807 RepID=UPI002442D27F|nr:class I SAM-dependent rRNA methyltransferase [Hahella sp. CR1]MDG9670335.1 class I SAM-dependent rRNA methyltransferase [Hahella sp. CR1]